MMLAIRDWISAIVICALLLSTVQSLIPDGAVRRVVDFAGGLLLTLCVLNPLLHCAEWFHPDLLDIGQTLDELEWDLKQETDTALKSSIEERTKAYISEQAEALGVDVTAEITAEQQEDGVILPVWAELRGPYSGELSKQLDHELGIPPERQVWHEGKS